jgi:S-layer protein
MTLSTAQLTTEYTNVDEGWTPDAATQLLLAAYAQQTIGGGITDAAALSLALHIPPPADGSVGDNTPENSTDVALGVYQFFTGMAPTLAGLDFLVNNDGAAPINPNDLDSAYYAGFNQANRYYNFAINLITGNPAAAASFAAGYGSPTVSINQAIATAYEAIVGTPNVGAAAAAAAVAAIEAQIPYFEGIAAARAPTVNLILATKAIAISYIIEEAIKANVGYYAFAIDQFNTILAGNPEAVIPGETANGIDLLTAFPISTLGATFTLTPAIDTIVPPSTNNNTVIGTDLTFTPFDNINLGSTTGNVFDWSSTAVTGLFETVVPTDAAVSGVQTFNISSVSGVSANTDSFSGLNTLNADVFTFNGSTLEAGPTTAINLIYTDTAAATGDITVIGGSIVSIEQDNPSNFNPSDITVIGESGTNTVNVTETGTAGDVTIDDNSTTIANVSLSGVSDADVNINGGAGGTALANLSVSNSEDTSIYIDATSSPAALNLSLSNVSGDTYVDDQNSTYSTLNVILHGSASLDLYFAGITTENISGTGVLSESVYSDGDNLAELESIVVSGAAGFFDDDFSVQFLPELTSIDASASSGTITTTLNDQQTSFLGGSGTDFVIVFADATVPVTGGHAGNNEIVLNVDGSLLTAGGTYANVTNFQILGTAFNSGGTYNLGAFAVPIANVDVRYDPTSALTFTGASVNQTLSVDVSITHPITLIQGAAAAAGSHNVLNLNIGSDVSFLGVSATDGIDTSIIGTGFLNPVGTDVSVAHHLGLTATTVSFFDTGADLTHWMDVVTLTATPNGGTLSFADVTHSITTSVTFTSSVASTDANFFASQVNLNDPNVNAVVSFNGVNEVITITSDIAGTAGNLTGSNTSGGGGTAGTTIVTAGTNASPDTGSIQVTATDAVPNQINLSDSTGGLAGFIALTGGESKLTVANDIAAVLLADGFTGISVNVVTDTVSFTYPSAGESGLLSTDTVAQIDTISLAAVPVAAGDVFTETFTGNSVTETVSYTAVGGDTTTQVAAGLAAAINVFTGATTVTATASGSNLFLTEIVGDATLSFTSHQVSETTFPFTLFFSPFGPVGTNPITANNYQTVNLDTRGLELGGHNTTLLMDNALTTLNISGAEDLNLATGGGQHLAFIDTTGASGFLQLIGIAPSEVTTGITANLGNASVDLLGNANAGFTDVITGGNGTDIIVGNGFDTFFGTPTGQTGHGGNTIVTLGDGNNDVVAVYNGTHNVISLGNGHDDLVYDFSNGADTISLGNGHDGFVLLAGSGNSSVTFGSGANDFLDDEGSGNNVIHFGNGGNDTAVTGTGMDTVVFGTGSGDTVQLSDDTGAGSGIVNVTFHGALATVDLSAVDDASFLTPTTTSQVDILTNNVSVFTGLVHGDTITLPTFDTVVTGVHNMAGVAGEAIFTTGTYSGGGGTFTEGLAGHDALLTYDSGGGVFVSVVLVGGATESAHAVNGTGDNITF